MSEQPTYQKPGDDEIDLGVVFKGIQSFTKKILLGIINIFRFYYRHKFMFLGLIAIGVVLGYFYEKNINKTYRNNLLVTPNFESSDYLYSKLENLDFKIKQKDTIYLKQVFGQNYRYVKSTAITPVVDIYNFLSKDESKQDLFELLFEEEGNIEFIENPVNSRNFKFHRIFIEVKGEKYHQDLSEALMAYVNKNAYFNELKTVSIENLENQIKQNKSIIDQIDSIVVRNNKGTSFNSNSSGLTFNDNQGLSDLLEKKENLVDQRINLQNFLVDQSEIIRVVDVNYKVIDDDDFLKKEKTKLFPLLLIMLYSLFFLIRYIAKKAKALTK